MSDIAIWELMIGMGQDQTGLETGLAEGAWFWKAHWHNFHEQQMVTGNIIPNSHKRYLPFTPFHYRSYFINKITRLNLIHTEKTLLNQILSGKYPSFSQKSH
jgi:hypothetical protein